MINTLLVCDNNDNELGGFFKKCHDKIKIILDSSECQFNTIPITGNSSFEMLVSINADAINSEPFLFMSYSHGSENELLQNGVTPFLSTVNGIDCLKNSFAYCYACKAGGVLGKELCKKGALCFIGYSQNITIQFYFGAEDALIECATCGIKVFVDGKTTGQTLKTIKEKYTKCVDEFYLKDMFTASLFMQNRDALVLHGDSELMISDIDSQKIHYDNSHNKERLR
ncbi:MAG: hypothetical protein Q3M30_14205 [Candidatus Electrothrix sp. Rat3]|nr:hypothetical protein [Candidatus Electrothrix rattekaaiensis]